MIMRSWFLLYDDVRLSLIKNFGYSDDDAEKTVEEYQDIIKQALDGTTGYELAGIIDLNRKNNFSPGYFADYLALMNFVIKSPEIGKPFPDIKQRETEFCVKCNYPKYKNEPCRFCSNN